jgi:MFS transporter, FHS family, glucose/mannose:H+ symporter
MAAGFRFRCRQICHEQSNIGTMAIPATHQRFESRPGSLYVGFFLNGMAIVLTGALLPRLAQLNHMDDRQAGLLLATQSFGNFLGSFFVSSPPLRSLVTGTGLTFAGLLLASAVITGGTPLWAIYSCFLLFGFGLGEMAAAINLIIGRRNATVRASHLSAINFLWSLGAISSPILIAALITHLSLARFLVLFSFPYLLLLPTLLRRVVLDVPANTSHTIAPDLRRKSYSSRTVLYFALLFFLYGGTEMSLSGWLASYAQRFASATATSNPLAPAALWAGITASRAAGALFLHRIAERRSVTVSIGLCMLSLAALLLSNSTAGVLVFSGAAGFCLGPFFPATVSWAIGEGLPTRILGPLFAICGLGATTLPFLVGIVSNSTSSLRTALLLPILYSAVILGMLAVARPDPGPDHATP